MPELAAHLERVAKEIVRSVFRISKDSNMVNYEREITAVAAALAACAREELTEWRDRWRKGALEMVDPHYAKRGLHQKYLKLDNYAAGIDYCADELEERITELARAVGEKGKA